MSQIVTYSYKNNRFASAVKYTMCSSSRNKLYILKLIRIQFATNQKPLNRQLVTGKKGSFRVADSSLIVSTYEEKEDFLIQSIFDN